MERRPLLVAGLAAAAGAALSQPLDGSLRIALCAALCAAAVYAVASGTRLRFLTILLFAAAAGMASGDLHARDMDSVPAHTTRMPCTVLEVSAISLTSATYTCADDGGTVYAVEGSAHPPPVTGQRVLVRGYVEPFDSPRNPGEPGERALQAEKGLAARISRAHIVARLRAPAPTLTVELARLHAWARTQLQARMSEPYASIASGELWGAHDTLPPDLHKEFQETGTVHILVTAGLHLGVVALVVMSLLRRLTLHRALCAGITILCIAAYAIFSGAHLPSVRAAIMIGFGLAAYAFGAAPLSWNAFGFAIGLFALLRPESTTGASFALSFSCVGAITLLSGDLEQLLGSIALPEKVKEALILTVATQIGTWPLTACIFLLIAPYAIIANLLVVPVVGFTMILTALQLMFSSIDGIAQLFANADSWLLAWIVASVHTVASLPHSTLVPAPPPSPMRVAFYDCAIIVAAWLWRSMRRATAAALAAVAIAAVLAPALHGDSRLRITVLDVGQADGIVVQTPAGHVILIDAGGRLEQHQNGQSSAEIVGERVVVPFLIRAGTHRIDAMILSHPHGDHAGGFAPVLRAFHVDRFADSGQRYGGYAYNDALQTAHAEHVPIVYPRAGIVWRTDDGVTLTFLGPSLPFIESDNTINDNSIAFILQYKHFRMLFTGDAGVAAEQRFLNEGIDLHADVLKVGHHGSAYSSSPAFIAAVHPEYAIISVGRHNMFGHPAPSTIETLQRYGARIYRTDENGASTVVTDGRSICIDTML